MTEAEWNTSEDPAAMLRLIDGTFLAGSASDWQSPRKASDRKLRLWVEACRNREMVLHPSHQKYLRGDSSLNDFPRLRTAVQAWCDLVDEDVPMLERASLLRDIVGNPFQPVTLPTVKVDVPAWDGGPAGYRDECPWLTPIVLSLAQAAYDERDRQCLACNRSIGCEWCNNTRRLPREDGTLDPLRLAMLADALEEAGMPADQVCDECEQYSRRQEWEHRACHGTPTVYTGVTHPILAHLRSPGPHVRGCRAVDLILGKE